MIRNIFRRTATISLLVAAAALGACASTSRHEGTGEYVDDTVTYHQASNPAEDGLIPAEHLRSLWPHLLSLYPDFDEYQARTDRNIPVFLCDPL